MGKIAETFKHLQETGRKALMPYVTMGYPALESALEIVPAIAEAGADLVELGVPFSDPLADGATIQAAGQQALANGMSLALCLEQAATLRARGVTLPFVLMGYYNPIVQFGLERFVAQAMASGIDGLIVPDLPPEEVGDAVRRGDGTRTGRHLPAGPHLRCGARADGDSAIRRLRLPRVTRRRDRSAR